MACLEKGCEVQKSNDDLLPVCIEWTLLLKIQRMNKESDKVYVGLVAFGGWLGGRAVFVSKEYETSEDAFLE